MLSMSELTMNPNRKVTTVCYGKKQEWTTVKKLRLISLKR